MVVVEEHRAPLDRAQLLHRERLSIRIARRDERASLLQWQGTRESYEPLTLRITPISTDPPGTLRLEGRLRSEEVSELERSAEAGVRVLDLEDLVSADEQGLAALRRLRARGVEIRNASHYLAMLLA